MKKMKKMKILLLMLGFCLIFALSYAGNGKGSEQSNAGSVSVRSGERAGEKAGISEKKQNMIGNQHQLENKIEKNVCYVTSNGDVYEWRNRYNRRLERYESTNDGESMNRYLQRIAHRYRLQDKEIEDFVSWALKNRPWEKN